MSDTMPYPPADHIRVYRDGRIESCLKRGRVSGLSDTWHPVTINFGHSRSTYPTVHIKIDGKHRERCVHLVVLHAWRGAPLPGQIGRHLDDVRTNFHLDNLAWGTHEENVEDAKRNGRYRRGENNKMSKLSNEQRTLIKLSAITGGGVKYLAGEFGVTVAAAHFVAYGRPNRGTGGINVGRRTQECWVPKWDCPAELLAKKRANQTQPSPP